MELEPHNMPVKGISAAENSEAIPGYTLRERIGIGGMGAVYRALHHATGSEVAVKVMSPVIASDPVQRQMFRDEALMLGKLNHPNIVHGHEFGMTTDGSMFIAMELVEGKSLKERLRERNLTHRQKVNLIEQLCDALAYLHSERVIHRDVKPTNLLVTEDGNLKLVDFGLSGQLNPGQTGIVDEDHLPIFGSPKYCAPEQFSEETEVDFRSDIYSLGVLTHELFTGSLPGSMFICHEKRITQNCPFRELLLKSLEYEPWDRQSSVAEFRREFRQAIWRASHPSSSAARKRQKTRTSLANRSPRGFSAKSKVHRQTVGYLRISAVATCAIALVPVFLAILNLLSSELTTQNEVRQKSSQDTPGSFELVSNLRSLDRPDTGPFFFQ